jgi:hypothetical protein
MGRYQYAVYNRSKTPRYIVVWSIHWQVVEVQAIAPMADLSAAMESMIERLRRDGWTAEATAHFGFAFIRKDDERRLLVITERDPASAALQSFDPFRVKSTR